ncbi:MAG: Sua5/YciO/YrdC/YwlC family protein, partial [Planctomyces sp.]
MLNLSSQPAPSDALTRATRALAAEQLVVAPTETVFGLFALGSSPAAIERLRAARRLLAPSAESAAPSAWHAPTVAAAIAAIGAMPPAGERALRRLAPGPVTLVVERNAPEMAALRERLRVAPGVIDDGRAVMVRVSDAEHIAQLAAVGAMVGEGLLAASEPARNIDQARRAITQSGVEVGAVIEEPPPRIGRGSTLVRLPSAGGYVIERQGAMDGAYIHRRMERVVLFLCSGNTCRSPMAQAIATDLASRRAAGDGYATVAQSAGLS